MTKFTRRTALATMGAALATPALLRKAHAAEVTFRVHHFLPAVAPIQSKFMEPWGKKITEETNGAVEFQFFPSMQLGGKPPQLADQARQGICDISWTLPVYTPDRFPVAETMSLPFMVTNAEKTSVAMHKLCEEFAPNEYKGMKVLAYHTHDGGKLHTRNGPINSQADLKGLKLRVSLFLIELQTAVDGGNNCPWGDCRSCKLIEFATVFHHSPVFLRGIC